MNINYNKLNELKSNLYSHQHFIQNSFNFDRLNSLNSKHSELQSNLTNLHSSRISQERSLNHNSHHQHHQNKRKLSLHDAHETPDSLDIDDANDSLDTQIIQPKKMRLPSPSPPPDPISLVPEYQGLDPDFCLPTTALQRAKHIQDAQNAIWLHISRKEIPRVHKYATAAHTSHLSFHKRISLLTQREQRKLTTRTTKNNKEIQAKAKKVMREVLFHWRRNEKDERDVRRKADRDAYDKARAEEQSRESQRQQRKLNFLITQTELYSHFVGNKIKTDEAEKSNDTAADPNLESAPIQPPSFDFDKFEESNLQDIDYDDGQYGLNFC